MTDAKTPTTAAGRFLEAKERHRELLAYIERVQEDDTAEIAGSFGVQYWTTTHTNDPDMPPEMHFCHENKHLNAVLTKHLKEWCEQNIEAIYEMAIKKSEESIAFWKEQARDEYEQLFGKALEL